jgi:hypothetical protein
MKGDNDVSLVQSSLWHGTAVDHCLIVSKHVGSSLDMNAEVSHSRP